MIENLDADRLLAGPLGQWLESTKDQRAAAAKKSNMRFLMMAVVFIPLVVWNVSDGIAGMNFFGMFITMIALFGTAAWAIWPRHKATQEVKQGINEAIAGAIGITYCMSDSADPEYRQLLLHKMLPSHNRQRFEDFWQGEVAGHHFKLFEAHLEHHSTDSKGRSSTVTKFRGPFMTVGCGTKFTGTTILHRAGAKKRFGFFGGKSDSIEAAGKQLDAVDMVHPEFEDAFDVYSTDQVEARAIVHPSYVERLIAIENAFRGARLQALFADGTITLMLSAKNMFESGSLDASKDRAKLEETLRQFRSLAELAIELNRR